MTRPGLAAAALALLLAVHAAEPAAAGAHCLRPPGTGVHEDDRYVVVLATATADTVLAGWGDVRPRAVTRRARGPVYGLSADVTRAAGPAGAGVPAGRAVLVPWDYDCRDEPIRWWKSFGWLGAGTTAAVVGRLRRPEDWVSGVPTIDVLRPEMVRAPSPDSGRVWWNVTPDDFFGFYATIPSRARMHADPWGSVAALRAWIAANPEAARDPAIRYSAGGILRAAADASVRAAPSPLAGTYRFQVSRTGGPTHTVYLRTVQTPSGALLREDTAALFPSAAEGYTLTAYLRSSLARLPSPRPGLTARVWRRITHPQDDAPLQIRLPATRGADGARGFKGHLNLWVAAYRLFPGDPQLRAWISEWSRANGRTTWLQPRGDIVVRPDGGLEWLEVLVLPDGRAVTIRGVRLSGTALKSAVDEPPAGPPIGAGG